MPVSSKNFRSSDGKSKPPAQKSCAELLWILPLSYAKQRSNELKLLSVLSPLISQLLQSSILAPGLLCHRRNALTAPLSHYLTVQAYLLDRETSGGVQACELCSITWTFHNLRERCVFTGRAMDAMCPCPRMPGCMRFRLWQQVVMWGPRVPVASRQPKMPERSPQLRWKR